MGLFGRKSMFGTGSFELEEPKDIKEKERRQESSPAGTSVPQPPKERGERTAQPQLPPPVAPSQTQSGRETMSKPSTPMPPQQPGYSIEDVMRLMRELPDAKREMVVVIVQKTLQSAKINIQSLLDDATRKVDKLQQKNDKLIAEIRDLEETIIQRKAEVDRLSREIEETQSVKQVFDNVYSRHVRPDGSTVVSSTQTFIQSPLNTTAAPLSAPSSPAEPKGNPGGSPLPAVSMKL